MINWIVLQYWQVRLNWAKQYHENAEAIARLEAEKARRDVIACAEQVARLESIRMNRHADKRMAQLAKQQSSTN